MVSEYRSKSLTGRHKHTMALDQSALLDLLGQLKLTDVSDRIRAATETLYQQLIDAEATAFVGAAPFERTGDRTATQPQPAQDVDDHRGGTEPEDPEAAGRVVFPGPAGAAPARGPGLAALTGVLAGHGIIIRDGLFVGDDTFSPHDSGGPGGSLAIPISTTQSRGTIRTLPRDEAQGPLAHDRARVQAG